MKEEHKELISAAVEASLHISPVQDRDRRKKTSVSVVRRGAETAESVVTTYIGPFTKRCVVCDEPSESAVCISCKLLQIPLGEEVEEWDYPGGYSRSDILFGGNW